VSGWIYGVYHPLAPVGEGDTLQVKVGKSKHDPNKDALDGRVRKLDLSVVALGLGPVSHAFEPFQVSDHHEFEKRLKAELKASGAAVPKVAKRYLTEVYRVSRAELTRLIERLKKELEA
jgi:hypothetical protein